MTPTQQAKAILLRELETRTTQEVAMDYGLSVNVTAGLKYNQDSFELTSIHTRKVLRAEIAIQAQRKRPEIPMSKEEKEYKARPDAFEHRKRKGPFVWGGGPR